MEEFRKANAPPEEPKAKTTQAKPANSLNQQRVAALAADLRKIVSKDQKQKLLAKKTDANEINKEDSKVAEEEEDHKSDSGDDEPEVDLQNLPSDPEERLKVLGLDPSLLDTGDQELIMVMEMSKI